MLTLSLLLVEVTKHFNSLWIHKNFRKILLFRLNIWSQSWKYSSVWTYCAYVKSLKPFLVFNPHKIPQASGIFQRQAGDFRVLWSVQSVYLVLMVFSHALSNKFYSVYLEINCTCAPDSYQDLLEVWAGDRLATWEAPPAHHRRQAGSPALPAICACWGTVEMSPFLGHPSPS